MKEYKVILTSLLSKDWAEFRIHKYGIQNNIHYQHEKPDTPLPVFILFTRVLGKTVFREESAL